MTTQIDASTDVEQFAGTVATDVTAALHAASGAPDDKLGWWAALVPGPVGTTQPAPRTRIFEVRP
jgi:hypothetical protein